MEHPAEFHWKMLNWASRFNISAFLDSHSYSGSRQCLLAAGAITHFTPSGTGNTLAELFHWKKTQQDWAFGHLGFGLAEETEGVHQYPESHTRFGNAFFFAPEHLLEILPGNRVRIGTVDDRPENIFQAILSSPTHVEGEIAVAPFIPRIPRTEYIAKVKNLQAHILRGDCYEINFCQEFFTQPHTFNPLKAYQLLSQASPAPFGGYYRNGDQYVISASPERYLKKTGNTLLSQPMKGTWERDHAHPENDRNNMRLLRESAKERAENIMIVDLVRNDLSRVAAEGSVKVEELCGVYSFPQVHQMISTITGSLPEGTPWTDAIRHTFPMGSMTGAPKKRVLELTFEHETTARGIYAGSIGYVTPENDFDFNVVIRSLVYNSAENYLSYHVGSGITGYATAEKEYEECLLKAEGILKALSGAF